MVNLSLNAGYSESSTDQISGTTTGQFSVMLGSRDRVIAREQGFVCVPTEGHHQSWAPG